MLDNHNQVVFAFQTTYDFQQQGDVGEVQAGGGFVEDVERSAGFLLVVDQNVRNLQAIIVPILGFPHLHFHNFTDRLTPIFNLYLKDESRITVGILS